MVEYSDTVINIISAFLVVVLGLVVANIVKNVLRKFLRGFGLNRVVEEQLKFSVKIEEYTSSFFRYFIYLITIIIALDQLGLPTRILKIIFIVIIIIVVVFTVLAFKDWVPNLIAGFYIYKNKKVRLGDIISVNGVKGRVVKLNFLETKIETNKKELIFIPNSNMIRYEVVKRHG